MTALPLLLGCVVTVEAAEQPAIERLGKAIFFDTSLSTPGNKQGCVSCHAPAKGWTFPDAKVNRTTVVAPGAKPHRFGNVKSPNSNYASQVPVFQTAPGFFPILPGFAGGNFWNGRAEGCGKNPGGPCPVPNAGDVGAVSETITANDIPAAKRAEYEKYLGPTADQDLNPFPNTVEQNAGEKKTCQQVKTAKYKKLYDEAYGQPIICQPSGVHNSFKLIALALGAWQESADVASFSSKRDKALVADADGQFPLDGLTAQENLGHDLFYGKAGCTACHNGLPDRAAGFGPPADPTGVHPKQLYTDHRYHHIAVPFNREIPGVAKGVKTGLAEHVSNPNVVAPGFNRTPTMRNVAQGQGPNKNEKAYFHNGWAKSLKAVVHFYNTRTSLPACETLGLVNATEAEALAKNCWPRAEFDNGFDSATLGLFGNLGLTDEEENAIVAYLETLSDQHIPKAP
jgi:cytochrome c peroxidase